MINPTNAGSFSQTSNATTAITPMANVIIGFDTTLVSVVDIAIRSNC